MTSTLTLWKCNSRRSRKPSSVRASKRGGIRAPARPVQEAMARWEEAQRLRLELLAALDEGDADLEAGRYREYDADSSPGLVGELKREAREFRAERSRLEMIAALAESDAGYEAGRYTEYNAESAPN